MSATPSDSLNQDQKNAVKAVCDFAISDKTEFFLTGAPGVGKTYTTKELIRLIPSAVRDYLSISGSDDDLPTEIVLTSTTNKASAVLSKQTGEPAQTIHSFLGVVPKVDYKTNSTSLKRTKNWQVHSGIFLIVDECSMIDSELSRTIQEALDGSCKVLYIGDKDQLPPVMEKISKSVLLADDPDKHYEITTPVRNSNSPALIDLCNRLRSDIRAEVPKSQFTYWKQSSDQIIWLDGPEMQNLVNSTFGPGGLVKADDEDIAARILCYTNRKAVNYNRYIRGIRGLPDLPTPGEVMVNNRHLALGREKFLNVEEEVKILSVGDPQKHDADAYNSLSVIPLEISTPYLGRQQILVPEDTHQFDVIMNHFKKNKNWYSFYKLQEKVADLRNREASTVHKAQGSTYDFTILCMADIMTCRDPATLRRMLYVAASRAKSKVYVYEPKIHTQPRSIYQ